MRPYYVQIRNQKQEVIEELIDYLALDDMIITEPDGKVRPLPRSYHTHG